MPIEDWFWPWVDRHIGRFPRADWPPLDAEFWRDLRHLLVTAGATEDVADEASRRMFVDPPGFPDAHPKAIREQVKAVFRERLAGQARATGPVATTEDTGPWNAAAAAHWSTLTEDDRDAWRDLARSRCLYLTRTPTARDLMAQAWAYDPSWIVPLPPKQDPPALRGPRRVFDALPAPKLKTEG